LIFRMKNTARTLCAVLIGLAGGMTGCVGGSAALQTADAAQPQRQEEARPKQKADPENQRAILNEGYSLLYSELNNASKVDLLFLVKSEAQPVNEVTTAVTAYVDTLKATLERVARGYPAVDIELDPIPVMEQRKREGITKDRLMSFAPVAGLKDENFDRRVLQTLEGMLNQLRFLTKAIAEEEPEPSLKQIATTAQKKFEQLYGQVLAMLTDKYYVNSGETKVATGQRNVVKETP
jgi:hypothetical protein